MKSLWSANKSCRTCFKQLSAEHNDNLFETTIKLIKLSDMLIACTSLPVMQNDGLPEVICGYCHAQLIAAYEFRTKCVDSEQKFRTQFESIKTETNTETKTRAAVRIGDPLPIWNHKVESNELAIIESDDEFNGHETLAELQWNKERQPKQESVPPDERIREKSERYFRQNFKRIQNQSDYKFGCKLCGSFFKRRYHLERHAKLHDSIGKPFECDECKYRFSDEQSLAKHKIRHTEQITEKHASVQLYPCTDCTES